MKAATPSILLRDLRVRIMAVALLPLLIAIGVLAAYFVGSEIDASWKMLDERGKEIAARLADTASFDLFAGNENYLRRLLDHERVAQHCLTIAIADRTMQWRLISGESDGLPPARDVRQVVSWRDKQRLFFIAPMRLQSQGEGDPYIESGLVSRPFNIGSVLVVLSTDPIAEARRKALLTTVALTGALLLAAGLVGWRLSLALSKPLREIVGVVKGVAGGDTNLQVKEASLGELGELERGVNQMVRTMASHADAMAKRVQEATSELREQKQAAEAAVLARSKFLAAASHDLRQPLHALILLVEALKEKLRASSGGESLRLTEHIESSAHSMQALLNALLDISRLDAGTVVARPECFRVGMVLDRVAQQYAPVAAEKGILLHVHSSRLALFSDPVLLERILSNLLANAIRYTTRGRVILAVRRVQGQWARVEVWDTGKGIPSAFREKVFEEYFQLDNPERARDKGLGLGLAIVQRLARLLGSQVYVRSTLGKGSCFSLRLTRCDLNEEADHMTFEEHGATLYRPRPALVAFIEDDEAILEAMLIMFEQWGIDLVVGADGGQIKRELEELGRSPDAILSDYRLRQGRTGVEAIAELRTAFGPDIPAMLITGDTASTTIQAIANSGLPVLHKPIKPAVLRSYLNHLLASNRGK